MKERRAWRPLVIRLVLSMMFVGTIGLLTIGASGLLASGFGHAFGKGFIAGDQAGVTYSADRCKDFREYYPKEESCAEAAVYHHYDEIVGYRLDVGVLGVLATFVFLLTRRRWRDVEDVLPEGFTATVGTAVFGVATVGLLVLGLGNLVFEGTGSGAGVLLASGIASLVTLTCFGVSLLRTLVARVSSS